MFRPTEPMNICGQIVAPAKNPLAMTGEKIDARDPYREGFHRALMRYLVHPGHADSGVAQYHHCERVLAQELGVEPMPETQRLYRHILERAAGEWVEILPDVAAINAPMRGLADTIAVVSKAAE